MGERVPFMTHNFALVVCRHPEGTWLAVKETRNRGWWLPAGLVEQGESFVQAAHREVLEEAGIRVELKGVLRVEHSVYGPTQARMRVIFFAVPLDPSAPVKKRKDKESEEACWVSLDDLKALTRTSPGLRGPELYQWGNYIEKGGIIAPINLLCREEEKAHTEAVFFKVLGGNTTSDPLALLTAIENNDEAAVRKLLLMGVDCNVPVNDKLWSPLHLACYLKQEAIVFMLLLAEGNPNCVTHRGRSVLHFAVHAGVRILQMTLVSLGGFANKGAAVNHQDCNGDTALHFAASGEGKEGLWDVLVRHGADENIQNFNLKRPRDLV